jgi:hypothetical protein
LDDKAFKQDWGFLTRMYRARRCWWEAVIVCQTIALVAVSTFGVNIGTFFQCIIMTVAFGTHVYLLQACKPFVYKQIGRMMLHGVQCLLLTSFIGVTFQQAGQPPLDAQSAAAYGVVMGTVLLLVNASFVCFVLWQLAKQVQWQAASGRVKGRAQHVYIWVGKHCLALRITTELQQHDTKLDSPCESFVSIE